MHPLNNKKENNVIVTAAATIFTLAIIAVALSIVTAPVAATTNNTTAATSSSTSTTTPSSPSGIELSPNPIQQERIRTTSQTPINQTHMSITYSGNGTLTLPNTMETINITTNGSGIVSLTEQSVYGKETIRTEDGQTATSTFYEIVRLDPATGGGKGITMGVFYTDSTGTLAPLNGTILVGTDDIHPNGEEIITIWEWESGVRNNAGVAPPPPVQ
ncbi:MAG: hypothetical protein ICV68_17820 [Pyrinomonadaceae bacterium]|nr:hypothetical protein [Pyrinomonadaceae bacterium]